jgi:hypothetical protein
MSKGNKKEARKYANKRYLKDYSAIDNEVHERI